MRAQTAKIAIAAGLGVFAMRGQSPTASPGASGSSRAVQLQGATGSPVPGTVGSTQSAAASGTSTVSSSVEITGAYAGSVPSGAAVGDLSLAEAVKRALMANLGTLTASNSQRAERAMRLQELSALLPNISANLSETVTQVNLAAYGFKFNLPPGLNFSIPTVVGPYSYSQAQAALSQSVWDPVARKNWQVAKENDRAAAYSVADARELVVLATAQSYLAVLSLDARVASQRAQVANAQAIYNQAVTRKEAGTNARIDVTRSLVEYQTEQQRLTSLDADLRKQKIALARVVGLPLGTDYRLSDGFEAPDASAAEASVPDADGAIQEAWRTRRDLRATESQVKAAELAVSAARAERLPSVSMNGDYGVIGPNPASTHGVFAVTGAVNVPIWQGGRVKGDISEAEAALSQRKAELADARAHVEQDVRDSLIELQAVTGQVKVAESNRQYANETLAQARDRFGAGVATTVEVVQAQEQVANAENDYISSLFAYDLAKLSLARASGKTETDLSNLLKGNLR